jgi:ankyrin repeat protein
MFVMGQAVFAQDRYPLQDEDPAVITVMEDPGVDLAHPKLLTYTNPWKELLWVKAPLLFFERLLSLGKKIEPEFGSGVYESPLVLAIEANNYEAVDFLIRNGADVNRAHSGQRTPLHYAAAGADSPILELLIKAGADVNKTAEGGSTPLHAVFTQFGKADHKEKIEVLLANRADINAINSEGMTPLMLEVSVFLARADAVQALLAGRPDINAVDRQGRSALIIAAANVNDPAIITFLLNARADAKIEDNTGRTALDWFDLNRRISQSPVRKALKDRM